jgi:hypothetical protein
MKIYESIRNSRVVQILLLILVSLLVFELLSKSALYFILGIKDGNYAHYYEHDPKLNLITWTEGLTPHPYFGYESPAMRDSEQILSEVGDDDFVIGILGGSVADSFAYYSIRNPSHFESLREAIPTFGGKNLRIVNLATGGFKQPQQFFVVAYYMDKLDLVINIDGFNDAMPSHLLPVYPLDFPNLSAQFYERASQGGVYPSIGRTARWVYKYINRVPTTRKLPGLSRSSLYFICWYYLHDLLYRVVKASESAYYANEFGVHQSEALRKTLPKEFTHKRIAIWNKYTILEDDLVRKRTGKPVFFFLQPNQYLKNSKPFSDQEKQVAVDPSRSESIHEMMILLKAAAQDLRRSKVPIFDLTAIFSNTDETVYIDDCCHLNDLGNQIMVDAVVSNIMLHQRKALQ